MGSAAGAVPLDQVIVDGGTSSVYASFTLAGSTATNWWLTDTGTGNLYITEIASSTDADSIPDWWEQKYFAGRTNCTPTSLASR